MRSLQLRAYRNWPLQMSVWGGESKVLPMTRTAHVRTSLEPRPERNNNGNDCPQPFEKSWPLVPRLSIQGKSQCCDFWGNHVVEKEGWGAKSRNRERVSTTTSGPRVRNHTAAYRQCGKFLCGVQLIDTYHCGGLKGSSEKSSRVHALFLFSIEKGLGNCCVSLPYRSPPEGEKQPVKLATSGQHGRPKVGAKYPFCRLRKGGGLEPGTL